MRNSRKRIGERKEEIKEKELRKREIGGKYRVLRALGER
jgi:hypothetical protein